MVLALAGVAGAALVVLLGHGRSPDQSLRGASFTTNSPAGWTLTASQRASGVTTYELASTNTKLDDLGIPAPGEIGMTVGEYSVSTIATRADPDAATQSPFVLLADLIEVPRSAESRTVANQLHATSLDGAPAAAIEYSYIYDGVLNIQSDILARHGSTIVSIETDAEPQVAQQASVVMAKAIAHWHWRQPQATSGVSPPGPTGGGSAPTDAANIVGTYDVVGSILSTHGFSGESAGDLLLRRWLIRRSCTGSGCHLILTRDLAAATGVPPISAVLVPTHGGWTANFTLTQGCPTPSSSRRMTEHSGFRLWVTSDGLQATEHGHSSSVGGCAATESTTHWYASKRAIGTTQPTDRS
jgi:hypothetical protein